MTQNTLKKNAALAALKYVKNNIVIGVGTGSTVNYFIEGLASIKHQIKGAVASSIETEKRLKAAGIEVFDLNAVNNIPLYVDGADEFNAFKYLTKGGGGALTREKILATAADQFICIADNSKVCKVLGKFPIPIEVIPMARGLVARALVKLGATPEYRAGFTTDNGNIILDAHNLDISNPMEMESILNNLTGTVCNGIFARRSADKIIVASATGVSEID